MPILPEGFLVSNQSAVSVSPAAGLAGLLVLLVARCDVCSLQVQSISTNSYHISPVDAYEGNGGSFRSYTRCPAFFNVPPSFQHSHLYRSFIPGSSLRFRQAWCDQAQPTRVRLAGDCGCRTRAKGRSLDRRRWASAFAAARCAAVLAGCRSFANLGRGTQAPMA